MDIENLKLIINALNELGANSKEAFMWWLVLTYGSTYLFGLIWSFIAIYIIRSVYYLINGISQIEQLKKAIGVYRFLSKREFDKVCEVLKEHYNKNN